jgi:hypothetical protein
MLPTRLQRLLMNLRRAQPAAVKKAGRALMALGRPLVISPQLDGALLAECRFVPHRHALIGHLPKGGTVGEVGVETGAFSRAILEVAQPRVLHLFDLDFSPTAPDILANPVVRVHAGLSTRKLGHMPDGHFDWLYIDGDHSYAGVKSDCAAAASKVAPGGYLVFNDFAMMDGNLGSYGVHRAVCEFIVEHRWPVRFFAFNPVALYDIAIQRPPD